MVDFIFVEIPEWQLAKEIIESGLIGKLININVTWTFLSYDLSNQIKSWKTDVEQGGGALSFYFSHVFYYLEYFVGKIKHLDCHLSHSEKSLNKGETKIDMTMLFTNNCVGRAHMNIESSDQHKHIVELKGENGLILLKNFSDDFVDNFELIVTTLDKTQKIVLGNNPQFYNNKKEDSRVKLIVPIAKRFINWCHDDLPAKPDFSDGVRVQGLIESARKSHQDFHNK